jgi:ubiquinone biosynthesis protein COQ9
MRSADGFEPAREAVLDLALRRAPAEGWTPTTLRSAAREAGYAESVVDAAFPKGVSDLLAFWSEALDRQMTDKMVGPAFETLRVRDKVAFAVRARLDALSPDKEAARRAAATLALPHHAPLAMRLVWRTADAVWRAMADKSTDFNFYSKRVMLMGVWTSTFARWLADDDPARAATEEFLLARIDNVMQFEKAKARVRKLGFDPEKPARFLGGLRYPARSDRPPTS